MKDYSNDTNSQNEVRRSFAEQARLLIQAEFPERAVVVAGGCVRDVLRCQPPKDYDVFILGCENPNEMKDKIAKRLTESKFTQAGNTNHISEPYLAGTYLVGGYHVQVMASDYKTMEELIDSFDWNVSRFAFDGVNLIGESISDIGSGSELKLHKLTFPYSTLRRGFRFSERFKMSLPIETIDEICLKITKRLLDDAKAQKAEPLP